MKLFITDNQATQENDVQVYLTESEAIEIAHYLLSFYLDPGRDTWLDYKDANGRHLYIYPDQTAD